MTAEQAATLIGAVLAWYDTEAAFGISDPRTAVAAQRMRQRVRVCSTEIREEPGTEARPTLTVIPGGLD